ncbi:MAG: addiction module protein [Nitrospiraceae bacterium]|nr:addiction module protein [Nitrospiraceae bacterium]
MSVSADEIEARALLLSPRERAILAEHLIDSLDKEEDSDAEKWWIEEAERRFREYKEGIIETRPADLVFKEARERYR